MANELRDTEYRGLQDFRRADTVIYKDDSITGDAIASTANIDADSVQQIWECKTDFGVDNDASIASSVYKTVHIANGAETIREARFGIYDTGTAGTNASTTFNLYKVTAGGTTLASVLSSTVTLTGTSTDNTPEDASISSASLADNDRIVAYMNNASGSDMKGPFAEIKIEGDA